jgi:nicotinate phosphoribosyltransferase
LNELYAFIAYAVAYPTAYNALVDSYSTKTSGCLNFIIVSLALSDLGY